MTFTLKQLEVNNYYIEMYQAKFESCYRVRATHYNCIASDNVYVDPKKASRQFNALVRRFKNT